MYIMYARGADKRGYVVMTDAGASHNGNGAIGFADKLPNERLPL